MSQLNATFEIPEWIAAGLATGVYERVGGVIRHVETKQVVAWLRDASGFVSNLSGLHPSFDPVTGSLNLIVSVADTVVSARGFAHVKKQLNQMQGVLQVTSAASILNLGVSAVGFSVIVTQLRALEKRLQSAQKALNKMNRKIDLGFYANFRAALDLATNAFTMSNLENRRNSALQAINRFLEAEHIYTDFVDQELEERSQITDEYLLTLCLAYLAETRCYLELEEPDVAFQRFQEGVLKIRSRVQNYVQLLLTSNPSAYLDPRFKGQINLSRLTRIYHWLDPNLNENSVFEMQRDNLFNLKKEQGIESGYTWVNALPPAIVGSGEVKGSILGNREEKRKEAIKRLPQAMKMMESMIETCDRFESYQLEAKAIAKLGLTFHEWMKLAPAEPQPEGANLLYIVPSEPLAL